MSEPNCNAFQCPFLSESFQAWREEMRSSISRIERSQQDLRHELMGNGQPGSIQLFRSDLGRISERVGALEGHHNQTLGRSSVLAVIAALVVSILVSVASAAITDYLHSRHSAPQHNTETTR